MHKQASRYIAEIEGQRQRLRIDMPDATFCTWLAETLTILEYMPEMAHMKQRFIDVERSNDSVVDKVKEVRGILSAVVRRISSELFGTGIAPASPLPNIGGNVFTQTITQSIDVSLDELLQRVDEVEGISDENKEGARSVVRDIWEYARSGVRDNAKWIDLTTKLILLGFKVPEILAGL